jgi:DNA-binding LacI/PurR family transcriptional regulator
MAAHTSRTGDPFDNAEPATKSRTGNEKRATRAKRATSYDVALLAGVSQSAVSRALSPGAYISLELRDKVLAAASQLSYQPNAMARGLSTSRSRVVALFMPNSSNPIYPFVLQNFNERLRKVGRQVQLLPPVISANEALAGMLQYQVDGLVITAASPLALSKAITRRCLAADIPVVLFNRYFQDLRVSSISCDNARAGAIAADLLFAAGHRHFAFIGGPERTSTHIDRCKGFVARLEALGAAKPLMESVPYNYDGGYAAAMRLFSRKDRPDALFCANDMLAIGAQDAARLGCGMKVPRDVSIIGFDGAPMAAWAGNSLTTFQMRVDEMVERAVEQLMLAIERGPVAPQRIKVASELVIRGSAQIPKGFDVSTANRRD